MKPGTIACIFCLLLGVMALSTAPMACAEAGRVTPGSILRAWAPLPDETLDRMRGGFVDLSGLKISFGLERQVWVNGELMQSLTVTVPDLLSLRKGPIGAVNVQGPVVPQLVFSPPVASPTTVLPPGSTSTAASALAAPVASPAASTLQDALAAKAAAPSPSIGARSHNACVTP